MTDIPEHIMRRMREAARDIDGIAPADWQLIAAIEALGGEAGDMHRWDSMASFINMPLDQAVFPALLIPLGEEGEDG